jgi:LDH2 family malate/lactate/ureidoglycolate dehydrogenase
MSAASSPTTVRVSVAEEMRLATAVLGALGVPEADAWLQAHWLVEGDRRGYGSHGIQRLVLLAKRITRGVADPSAQPTFEWRGDSLLDVDGNRGLGPVVAIRALEEAYPRSRVSGVVLVAISNANHLGMLAPYLEWLTERSLIGIALTTSEALVHPWGGRRAMVGTNPLAIGVPTHPRPLVVDLATGTVSMGKILRHCELGLPLERGWAVDAAGQPTLDPAAALDGAISPFGGAKGFALGLAFEVFVGALTRSALGRDVVGTLDADAICNKGDVFICIDPATLGDSAARLAAVSDYLALLRSEPPQEGAAGVRLPGDRAAKAREASALSGVELPARVWQETLDLASDLHIDLGRAGGTDTTSSTSSRE